MKVTWNSHSYARFLEPVFRVMPDLKTRLLTDFVSYKNGFYPDSFGKDGPYTAPGSVVSSRVYHVHLLFTKEEKKATDTGSTVQAIAPSFTPSTQNFRTYIAC